MYRAAADDDERNQKPEVYSGTRYIACQVDGSTRAYNEVGFSPCEPPVLIDESVVLVSYEELLAIKAADQKKPTRKKKAPEPDEQDDGPSLDVELPF